MKCLLTKLLSLSSIKGKDNEDYEIEIFEKISDVDFNAINEFCSDLNPTFSIDYFRLVEKNLPNVKFQYIVAYFKSKPVLFTYYQLHALTYKNFTPLKSSGFLKGLLNFFLKVKKLKVLILGDVLRNCVPTYWFDKHSINEEKLFELLFDVGEHIMQQENASALLLKDFNVAQQVNLELSKKGFLQPWKDIGMELQISDGWKLFDDYTKSITRKYASRAKKVRKNIAAFDIRILSLAEIGQHQQTLNLLFGNVIDHQGFKISKPEQTYFYDLKELYKEKFEVTGFFLGEELIAFYSAFNESDYYEIYYVGFDYLLNIEYNLYFNILFHGLEKAIVLNKKVLKLGRTSFDAKASLGAVPVEFNYSIKFKNIPDFVINSFICYFSSLENIKWKERNPFRTTDELVESY